jgi:carbon-monoxide dehydrogenase large subunit
MAGFKPTERPLLAHDRVRFVGDAVALVLGTNPYGVYDAVDLVVVDYEPLPPVVDIVQAIATGAPLVHDTVPGNVVYAGGWSTDGFGGALAASHCLIEETFCSSRVAAVSIEPRGCVASFDRSSGKLTLWTSSQVRKWFTPRLPAGWACRSTSSRRDSGCRRRLE